ncbi:MAG: SDR family NAD(P)-dependent oxidoreductase [Immundisolibacter sp.]|uniref:SDR family NAD(P)-dependent oxidoreductase n=1 Tax=Immundisolibacter sp. TaxID=1934948 RepID=UPI003EDEEC13
MSGTAPGIGDITDKRLLIIGASRGIGLAIATRAAQQGAVVHLTARSAQAATDTAAAIATQHGARATGHGLDLAASDATARLDAVLEVAGELDALIYNAGLSHVYARPENISDADFDQIMAVNLRGPFLAARAFGARCLRQRRPGAIVFIASVAGFVGSPRLSVYAASKAGMLGLSRSLAVDWAADGIRVNAVAPGWVATDMTQGLQDNPRLHERLTTRVPMGRFAQPEEIADVALFLASDSARYVTGSVYSVDGGLLAG